jgi:hypothetical protein
MSGEEMTGNRTPVPPQRPTTDAGESGIRDGLATILAGCVLLLSPGGVVVVHAALAAGLAPAERCVALLAAARDNRLMLRHALATRQPPQGTRRAIPCCSSHTKTCSGSGSRLASIRLGGTHEVHPRKGKRHDPRNHEPTVWTHEAVRQFGLTTDTEPPAPSSASVGPRRTNWPRPTSFQLPSYAWAAAIWSRARTPPPDMLPAPVVASVNSVDPVTSLSKSTGPCQPQGT